MGPPPKSQRKAAEDIAAQFERAVLDGRSRKDAVDGVDGGEIEEMSPTENVKVCATLAMQLLWAKLNCDATSINLIINELMPASKCDPNWVSTISSYIDYFGPDGTRREIPYITPTIVGPRVVTIKAKPKVALFGDWGTGALPAINVLKLISAQNPDVLIRSTLGTFIILVLTRNVGSISRTSSTRRLIDSARIFRSILWRATMACTAEEPATTSC
jgi:hypothetical protein